MTDAKPILVTWNCGHCDVIHEQGFDDTDTARTEALRLCAMIVINEDIPDFQVRVLRDGAYVDDTEAVQVAIITGALQSLFTSNGGLFGGLA